MKVGGSRKRNETLDVNKSLINTILSGFVKWLLTVVYFEHFIQPTFFGMKV